MDQPGTAFVKKRAGIDPAGDGFDQAALPRTRGIFRCPGIKPFVRHAGIDIKGPLMIPDTGRPDPAAVGRPAVPRGGQAVGGVTDDLPVDQIPGMEDRQAGHIGEGGRGHIEILSDADDVRIGEIHIQNGIQITHELFPPDDIPPSGPGPAALKVMVPDPTAARPYIAPVKRLLSGSPSSHR